MNYRAQINIGPEFQIELLPTGETARTWHLRRLRSSALSGIGHCVEGGPVDWPAFFARLLVLSLDPRIEKV
jgi:hypothetical protein